MIYSGKAITVQATGDSIAELCFDLQDESVNKFNALTVGELKDATAAVAADKTLKGVIVTSGKPVFIVGADITEFGALFGAGEDAITDRILTINLDVFNAFEDLPIPTVAAINGIALGGGFEMALVCDYRVLSETARIGFPETKLGIIPGYGGTTRLPRLIGADNAIEWIASGKEQDAAEALRCGAVDAVVAALAGCRRIPESYPSTQRGSVISASSASKTTFTSSPIRIVPGSTALMGSPTRWTRFPSKRIFGSSSRLTTMTL